LDVLKSSSYPYYTSNYKDLFILNTTYSFGFNGKENDNEVKGEGNQQDYGMRIYDPRIGKFLSSDPLTKEFPMLTPYQFASNTPIQAIDLDGLEAVSVSLAARAAVPLYGCLGVTGSGQIGLILDHQFNLVMYCTVSAGVSVGSGVSAGMAFTGYPTVDSYEDLLGSGANAGFIGPINRIGFEGNASFSDKTNFGGTLSIPNSGVSFGEAAYADVSYTNLVENFGKISSGNWKSMIQEIAKTSGLSESVVTPILQNMVKNMTAMTKQTEVDATKKTEGDKQTSNKPNSQKPDTQSSTKKETNKKSNESVKPVSSTKKKG